MYRNRSKILQRGKIYKIVVTLQIILICIYQWLSIKSLSIKIRLSNYHPNKSAVLISIFLLQGKKNLQTTNCQKNPLNLKLSVYFGKHTKIPNHTFRARFTRGSLIDQTAAGKRQCARESCGETDRQH